MKSFKPLRFSRRHPSPFLKKRIPPPILLYTLAWNPENFKSNNDSLFTTSGGLLLCVGLIVIFFLIILVGILYKRYHQKTVLENARTHQLKFALENQLQSLDLTPEEEEFLAVLVADSHLESTKATLDSVWLFEEKVVAYKRYTSDAESLRKIYHLRQRLGFASENAKIPLICTQMLVRGAQLECRIERPPKVFSFIVPVLGGTENFFCIKTPHLKEKPVNFEGFTHLDCKLRKSDDKDYTFKVRILKQVTGKIQALMLEHTREIKEFYIRESERVRVQIRTTFYILSEETRFPQSLQSNIHRTFPQFLGTILDLSLGGLNVIVLSLYHDLHVDDVIIFYINGIHTKEGLSAKVVAIHETEIGHDLHLQFFRLTERDKLKLERFLKNITDPQPAEKELDLV